MVVRCGRIHFYEKSNFVEDIYYRKIITDVIYVAAHRSVSQ